MSTLDRSALFRRRNMYDQVYRPCRSTGPTVPVSGVLGLPSRFGVPLKLNDRSSDRLNCLSTGWMPPRARAAGVGLLLLSRAVPKLPRGIHGALADAGRDVSRTYSVRRGMR